MTRVTKINYNLYLFEFFLFFFKGCQDGINRSSYNRDHDKTSPYGDIHSAKRSLLFESEQQSKRIFCPNVAGDINTSCNDNITKSQTCVCTCCHRTNLKRKQCIIFRLKNYDMRSTGVAHRLAKRYCQPKMKELICKRCHEDILDGGTRDRRNPPQQGDKTGPEIFYVCTCCRKESVMRRKYIVFKAQNYDMHNKSVADSLIYRFENLNEKELICRPCHTALLKCVMPVNAISSPTKARPHPKQKCLICDTFKDHKMRFFNRQLYGTNTNLDDVIGVHFSSANNIICSSCHVKYLAHMNVTCKACNGSVIRKKSLLLNPVKYPAHSQFTHASDHSTHRDIRICVTCHRNVIDMWNKCVICQRTVSVRSSNVYEPSNYDRSQFIVDRCTSSVPLAFEDVLYICKSCDKTLVESTDQHPIVPRSVKDPLIRKGSDFLNSLSEFPAFPCTCCHRMLFSKTVKPFSLTDYDLTNDVVQKCLSHRLALRLCEESDMSKVLSAEQNMLLVGPHQYICTGTIDVPEYICVRCKGALTKKRPTMPDQACANGLLLYDIPDELVNMFPIERRVISFRIPFITLIVIRRYGGHYKVNGPPVNVPAKLDQIVHILPRMPNQLQLHPLKLKRRLEYKSHYMYDMLRKDKVVGAIMWLKDNNKHYTSIPIDTSWLESESENEISVLPNDSDDTDTALPNDPCDSDLGNNRTVTDSADFVASHDSVASHSDPVPFNLHTENVMPKQHILTHIGDVTPHSHSVASEFGESNKDRDDSDDELVEDQAGINHRQDMMGDPLPSVVQFDSLENTVYNCAPGENNIPKYILLDDDFEVLAFPDLFPYGYGGYNSRVSHCRLPIRKYFQQRLLNVDGRFAKNMEYIFCAQYIADIQQIQSDANLAIRLSRGRTLNGQKITAGILRDPSALQQLVRTEQAYKFLKNVRGSPSYWQGEMYDVLAMLKSLGIPTWFLTLSAADLHWPEMIQAIARQYGIIVPKKAVDNMSAAEKSLFLRHNPVTGVRMFLHRVENFFSRYLLSSANPIGNISDYVIKIEFQMRGTPHAHCLVWVKDAPKIDKNSDEEVCQFIDKYITAVLPGTRESLSHDKKLMLRLQQHSHSDYCRRNKKCRFGFPKAPSQKTVISRKPENDCAEVMIDNAKDVLKKVQDELSSNDSGLYDTVEELLFAAGVGTDTYARCLMISARGPNIVLRRSPQDIYINSCNRDILRLWGANVDLQYVINEIATVMYVCSYMTKGEKAMGETLKRVAKECRNDDMRTQMNKIKREFLGKRVIGAPESCMRVLSSWLMKKSRKVVYVNSNMKCDRVSLPKTRSQLDKLHNDDEDVFATSLLDRYGARPDNLYPTCLATFAVSYDVVSSGVLPAHDTNSDGVYEQSAASRIKLKDGLGYMRKRKVSSILRTRHFKVATEPERYYHAKLILYFPWTNENQLIDGYETYQHSYQDKIDIITSNAEPFNEECDIFDIDLDDEHESGLIETAWDLVAPSIAKDDELTHKIGFTTLQKNTEIHNVSGRFTSTAPELPSDALSKLYHQAANRQFMGSSEYRRHIRGLNLKQRELIMYNRQWCKNYIHKYRLGQRIDGYRVFLSGCGGTGKSHVVRLVQRDMSYLLQHVLRPEPDQPIVVVTAPTGSAAYNIGGSTIHSALSINDRSKGVLSHERQCMMQVKLEHLMLLITDEISMVGFEFFQRMNQVVTCIKGSSGANWGNICVLTVGDLFQLPPVASAPVYMSPRNIKTLNDLAPNGWDQFKLHELTQVMRQNDMQFVNALAEIRMKQPEQGSSADTMLRSRELKCFRGDYDYPYNAVHVYAQNIYCDDWNETMLQRLPGNIVTHVAVDSKKDTSTNLANIKMPEKPRDTGNLRHILNIKVGARVMLTTNVDVSDGLTNGSMGIVQYIALDERGSSIKAVLVKFDGENVGTNAKKSSEFRQMFSSAVPIYKGQATFTVHGRKSCHASRTQFPLTLAWAVTIHKCQGLTLDEVAVDMSPSKGRFSAGQAYVAFSRVRELNKLHIINYTRSQIRVSPNAEAEMVRLRENSITCDQSLLMNNPNADIIIAHLNISGVMHTLSDIVTDERLKCAHVLSLNETHLCDNDRLDSEMLGLGDDFIVYRADRNRNGGGVALVIKASLQPTQINLSTQLEIIAIRITYPCPTVFVTVYRPPTLPVNTFVHSLCCVISSLKCDNICIVGDFNEDILLSDNKRCCIELKKLGLRQHVTRPTRDSGTLIDHLYATANVAVQTDVLDCYYSDHDFVFAEIQFDN